MIKRLTIESNMKKSSFILALIIALPAMLLPETKLIERNKTHFREGPGCYNPLIGLLEKGMSINTVDSQTGWVKIRLNGQDGWISENALKADVTSSSTTAKTSPFDNKKPILISRASASGSVRGFAQKFLEYHKGDVAFIDQYETSFFTPSEYQRFKQETYKGRDAEKIADRYTKKKVLRVDEYDIPFNLEKTGMAVAGQIAATGLDKNPAKLKYVNMVGTVVLEGTELYYFPFRFYLLTDKRSAAYSSPNGMIFVTGGLLKMVEDEAELACLLGHEMAHVIKQHGYAEMSKRVDQGKAEGEFDELDESIPGETPDVDIELNDLAFNMFEASTKKRQMEYEYEADKLGVIYAYKAGYDPMALVRILKRIQANTDRDFWNPESNWQADGIKDRIEKVEEFIKENLTKHTDWNVSNTSRYRMAIK